MGGKPKTGTMEPFVEPTVGEALFSGYSDEFLNSVESFFLLFIFNKISPNKKPAELVLIRFLKF